MRQTLPSLNALRVLEAATRHRGFTAAAQELGVTQAAVSRQIALLERELGTVLFVRRHRAVEPTPACQMLAASLALSFANIAESVEAVRAHRHQDTVTVGATLAVSSFWLLPRIAEFRERHPDAQIRVVSQDSRLRLGGGGGVDVAIRFGLPPFEDSVVVASRSDRIFPVCSPDYARRLAASGLDPWREGRAELIEHEVPDRTWYQWSDWLRRARIATRHAQPALSVRHFSEALQSARAGQGLALGWGLLVQDALAEGALVRLGEAEVEAEGRYNLLLPARRSLHPLRDVLVDWLASRLSARSPDR